MNTNSIDINICMHGYIQDMFIINFRNTRMTMLPYKIALNAWSTVRMFSTVNQIHVFSID